MKPERKDRATKTPNKIGKKKLKRLMQRKHKHCGLSNPERPP